MVDLERSEHELCICFCGKDFVVENPEWSPIQELATMAGARTQLSVDTEPNQVTNMF